MKYDTASCNMRAQKNRILSPGCNTFIQIMSHAECLYRNFNINAEIIHLVLHHTDEQSSIICGSYREETV